MSFFNDSSVCQSVGNPINKLLNVSTQNSDIGNFRTNNASNDSPNIHQYKKLDNTVQNEFYKFVELPHNNSHSFIFPQEVTRERISDNIQIGLETTYSSQHDWTKDFMNLDLRDNHERLLHQTNQGQISNKNGSKYDTFQSQHLPLRSMTHMSSIQSSFQSNTDMEFLEHKNTQVQVAELDTQFDAAFTEVEQELVIDTQKVEDEDTDQHSSVEVLGTAGQIEHENKFEDEDKIKFAILARSVFDIMDNTPKGVSSNTTNKFKKSGFMQLMNKISTREIEISNDKKKLVDQDGVDIRSTIVDPLYKLGVEAEPLSSPFEAALKVSSNVDSNAWQGDFI